MDEYENLKRSMDKILDEASQFLSKSVPSHIKWILAVNTGALLWFAGMLDKFTVNSQLAFKWWVILIILLLTVSEITLYWISMSLFKINLELEMLIVKYHRAKNIDEHLNTMNRMLPSTKICYVADVFFLIGIIAMITYIITYLVLFK